jgi:aspartate/methionine/tyrosine aminotransferase
MGRSGIREVFDLASSIPDAIHLEMGEPNFETPSHIREAAALAAEEGWTKYTPNAGVPALREALAHKIRNRNGYEVTADQIVVTPGAIAALLAALLTLCDPGDEILVSDPAWPNYQMLADLLGLAVRRFPLRPEADMQPQAADIESLIRPSTKLILLNSPCNPTGSVIGAEAMGEILEVARRRDLWVVSDEVYDEMVFEGKAPSPAALTADDRVVSVYSFSKTYAMTGWRVGYAAFPASMADEAVKTQEPTTACVNAPAQMAALAAVTGPQDCVAEMRDAYVERRDGVDAILSQAGVPFVRPSGAFYIWIDVSDRGRSSADFARELLIERQVAVTPGSAFGPGSDEFVRVSLATAPDVLYEGVRRLARSVAEAADL